jgi:hypothetical protein
MYIQFLDVGSKEMELLPCTRENLASELTHDLLPTFAVSSPIAYLGWPIQLLEVNRFGNTECLSVHPILENSDRQWKGFVSWMLGVAGARVVLKHMGYRWIAPASAFYQERTRNLSIDWPDDFPPSCLSLSRANGNKSKLRPDYLALKRDENGEYRITSVEAKGTKKAIMSAGCSNCPKRWYQQVRNIELSFDGEKLAISRYLVIGTRVLPKERSNIINPLAIRAWNSTTSGPRLDRSQEKVLPIVYANLYGIFHNLGQSEVCEGIRQSLKRSFDWQRKQMRLDFEDTPMLPSKEPRPIKVQKTMKEKLKTGTIVEVSITDELANLTEDLIEAKTEAEAVASFLRGEKVLDKWEAESSKQTTRANATRLSCGVEVEFK